MGLSVLGAMSAVVVPVLRSLVADSNPLHTEFTLQAIKDAEIPPMPADVIPLLPKNDRERLKIQYDVLIY